MDFQIILEKYILLFMIYSFVGWCMETTLVSIGNKKFVDRGFLIGPYCPIYGFGALSITIVLEQFSFSPVILFIMAVLLCGALEYFTSWIMEVVFKARWWDYSNRKFNLNGRICLRNLIAFGVLGLVVIYLLNPFFMNILNNIPERQLESISIILLAIFIADTIVSFVIVYGLRTVTEEVNKEGKADNTEQITKMVRETFSEKSFLHKRIIDAYPRLESIKLKMREIRTRIEDVTNDAKDKVTEKVSEARGVVTEKTEGIRNSIGQGTRKAKIHLYLGKRKFKGKFRKERE